MLGDNGLEEEEENGEGLEVEIMFREIEVGKACVG